MRNLIQKLLFWVEILALPFLTASIVIVFNKVVERFLDSTNSHNLDLFILSFSNILALILFGLSIWAWNKTILHNYIPCSDHGHDISKKSLLIVSVLFLVHLSFDHVIYDGESFVRQLAFYAHKVSDVLVLILLLSNWQKVIKSIYKPALILVPLSIIFNFSLVLNLDNYNFGHFAHITISLFLAFFLASFIHLPGKHKHDH